MHPRRIMGETALNSKLTPDEAKRLDSVLARVIDARDGLLAKHLWNAVAIARAHHRIDAIDPLLAALEARGGETMTLIDEMARLAFVRGELDTALSMLEERYRRSPSPSARIAIARFHLETGNANEAKRISDEVAMSDPSLLSGQQ